MSEQNQNRISLRLLRSFCPPHLLEEIEGDLIQKFERDVRTFCDARAKRRLLWNVIRFFRPGILLRNNKYLTFSPFYMLTNYFKIALRIMVRNKSYSAINVFGLALGMTGTILLGLWIQKEINVDQFHAEKEKLYNVWNRQSNNGSIVCWSTTPRVLASVLNSDFTAVESAISFANYYDSYLFTAGDTRIVKNEATFTDLRFLTMFSFPLIKGDASSALGNPNSIVVTEKFAHQLFGDKEAFGETITISQAGVSIPFTVTGILKDPVDTDFHFEFLLPFRFIESNYGKDTDWGNNSVSTWVKIKDGASLALLNEGIKDLKKKNSNGNDNTELFLHPLTRSHLYSGFENGVPSGGRIKIVRMLGLLGICLITIACINFINLSTARAVRRTKEIAVRKVTGALRQSLVMQFLCESLLVAFAAVSMSLFMVYALLPLFSNLMQQQIVLNLKDYSFWIGVAGATALVGLLAGGYPALYLSSFHPVRILKSGTTIANGKSLLRTLLVIIQFGFAMTLIVSTLVVYQQTVYVQNRDMGYAKGNLIYQYNLGDLAKNYSSFKRELIESGAAISVTRTSSPITERLSNTEGILWSGKNPDDRTVFERFAVDEGISVTAGMTIIEGRDMDISKYPSDSSAAILNETAVKRMGFSQPIGEEIEDSNIKWHVVGVVKDFILTSPYQKVEPMVMEGSLMEKRGMLGVVHIRLNPARGVNENLEIISKLNSKYNPDYPFEYHFVDAEYERKFSNTRGTLAITSVFTGLAIFIGCLGLLGLATYMIESRVKEIGIRKVLGGSVISIIRLLSGHSLKPIVWAIVVFSPGAWWGMNWWLQSFAYRISISPMIFVGAGVVILTIALATIMFQTFRAARANPVESLRSE